MHDLHVAQYACMVTLRGKAAKQLGVSVIWMSPTAFAVLDICMWHCKSTRHKCAHAHKPTISLASTLKARALLPAQLSSTQRLSS